MDEASSSLSGSGVHSLLGSAGICMHSNVSVEVCDLRRRGKYDTCGGLTVLYARVDFGEWIGVSECGCVGCGVVIQWSVSEIDHVVLEP